ncbi:MAG: hypothetical protein ACK5MN_08825 [Lachnospiraceae bacterium]
MKKQVVMVLLSAGIAAASVTACGQQETTSTETQATQTEEVTEAPAVDENSLMGEVTAIDGSDITLAVMTQPAQSEYGAGDSTSSEDTADTSATTDATETTESTETTEASATADTDATEPSEDMEPQTEEQLLTVVDSTEILTQGEDGEETEATLEDIQVGSRISATLDDAGEVSRIVIQNTEAGPGAEGGEAPEEGETPPTDTTTATEAAE